MSELWDIYDENRKPTGKTILRSVFLIAIIAIILMIII